MRQPMRIVGAVTVSLALFLLVAGLVVTVLTTVLRIVSPSDASILSGGSSDSDLTAQSAGATSEQDSSAGQDSSEVPPIVLDEETAVPHEAIERSLKRAAQALAAPNAPVNVSDALAQNALLDLQATVNEWNVLGYHQEGQVRVTELSILDSDTEAKTMQVLVCVDSSTMRVLDDSGREVSNADAPPRSQIIYDLAYIDGKWKVTELSFPEDPEC